MQRSSTRKQQRPRPSASLGRAQRRVTKPCLPCRLPKFEWKLWSSSYVISWQTWPLVNFFFKRQDVSQGQYILSWFLPFLSGRFSSLFFKVRLTHLFQLYLGNVINLLIKRFKSCDLRQEASLAYDLMSTWNREPAAVVCMWHWVTLSCPLHFQRFSPWVPAEHTKYFQEYRSTITFTLFRD